MIFRDKLTGGSNRPFRCLDFHANYAKVSVVLMFYMIAGRDGHHKFQLWECHQIGMGYLDMHQSNIISLCSLHLYSTTTHLAHLRTPKRV